MLIVRLGLILMLIASIASGGLALLNKKTAPIIAAYKAEQQAIARTEVMEPVGGIEFKEDTLENGKPYWKAFDADGNLVGYVGIAYGKGYSSTIETVSGFDIEFKITGLKITFQQETPGLGTKAVEVKKGEAKPWFLKQFVGRDATDMAVKKDRGEIDAITGATVTSRAVTNSVKDVVLMIKNVSGETPVVEAIESISAETETVVEEPVAPDTAEVEDTDDTAEKAGEVTE